MTLSIPHPCPDTPSLGFSTPWQSWNLRLMRLPPWLGQSPRGRVSSVWLQEGMLSSRAPMRRLSLCGAPAPRLKVLPCMPWDRTLVATLVGPLSPSSSTLAGCLRIGLQRGNSCPPLRTLSRRQLGPRRSIRASLRSMPRTSCGRLCCSRVCRLLTVTSSAATVRLTCRAMSTSCFGRGVGRGLSNNRLLTLYGLSPILRLLRKRIFGTPWTGRVPPRPSRWVSRARRVLKPSRCGTLSVLNLSCNHCGLWGNRGSLQRCRRGRRHSLGVI